MGNPAHQMFPHLFFSSSQPQGSTPSPQMESYSNTGFFPPFPTANTTFFQPLPLLANNYFSTQSIPPSHMTTSSPGFPPSIPTANDHEYAYHAQMAELQTTIPTHVPHSENECQIAKPQHLSFIIGAKLWS